MDLQSTEQSTDDEFEEEWGKILDLLPARMRHTMNCLMKERGQDRKAISSPEEKELYSKIMIAIRDGHVSVLQHIKEVFPKFHFHFAYNLYPAGSRKSKITTPLLYACECGQTQIVKYLLEFTLDTNKTKSEETSLILAVSNEVVDLELVQTLLKTGYQFLGAQKKFKKTALHIACSHGHVEVVKLLLDYNNSWTAKGKRSPKIITRDCLLDKHGNTPFLLAVRQDSENHRKIVRLWLEMERSPSMALKDPISEILNKKLFYPAMVAAYNGQLECLKIMAEFNSISDDACSQRTTSGWNILHCAVASGNLELLQWLLDEKPGVLEPVIDEPNKKGYTPFLMACEYRHLAMISFFLNLPSTNGRIEIDYQKRAKDALTCLHMAALHDDSEVFDSLLKHNGLSSLLAAQEARYGDTILHTALRRSSLNIEFRLAQEPEFERLKSLKNSKGETPEDVRNPVHVPFVIRKRGAESVRAYLKALREGNTKNSHCNLVVLGEERVGKTSLIKGVLGMDFDPNCQPTQGVQLKEIETVAECIDIKFRDHEETWEAIDSPLERIKEEYVSSVAKAINEASTTANGSEKESTDESIVLSEKELLSEVNRLAEIVKLQLEAAKSVEEEASEKGETTAPEKVSQPTTSRWQRLLRRYKRQEKRIIDVQSSFELTKVEVPKIQNSIPHNESKAIVKRIKKKTPSTQDSIIFHTIDFAGQSLYRPMHHCFITHRAVYIIVFKLTDVLKRIRNDESLLKNPISEIRYWLNNVIAHASLANDEPPKIFLVGTHRDGEASPANGRSNTVPSPRLSDKEIESINDELMSVFITSDNKRYRYAIQVTKSEGGSIIFAIENSLTAKHNQRRRESGVFLFMQRINEIKTQISFLKLKFPTSYIKFEQKILEMQKERKNKQLVTTKEEVREWAVECGIHNQEADINTAIEFYHDIRVIVVQDLISSPFCRPSTKSEESQRDLVILSPQWLGDMMCKIMQLKIGNDNYDKDATILLNTSGIICKKDLEKCLLGKPCETETERKSFNNFLNILESYCLIYRLSKQLGELLQVKAGDDLHFLVPSKMPPCKSKPFPKESYNFEFDFNSYLPHEVYAHCVCIILSKFSSLPSDRRRRLELSSSCSTFYYIKLLDEFIDLRISFQEERHTLAFSICPYESREELFKYIVEVDELIVSPVCRAGTLGFLSYKGGPRTKCSCIQDDETVLLPFVKFVPNAEGNNDGSPDTPTCLCECEHKEHNVDKILKSQMQPMVSAGGAATQLVQNFVIGSSSSGIVPNTVGHTEPSVPPPQPTNTISRAFIVKVAEEFYHEGKRLARYLGMKKQWNDIVKRPHSDDSDQEDIEIDNVQKLLEMWVRNDNGTKSSLKEALMMINEQKTKKIFDIHDTIHK